MAKAKTAKPEEITYSKAKGWFLFNAGRTVYVRAKDMAEAEDIVNSYTKGKAKAQACKRPPHPGENQLHRIEETIEVDGKPQKQYRFAIRIV